MEQQSEVNRMDDLISRQMLLEYIHGEPVGRLLCDKYNLDGLIEQFPSAQPRGKWIYHIDDLFPAESTKECDQCHAEQPLICDDEFCPHCGADMRGEQNG